MTLVEIPDRTLRMTVRGEIDSLVKKIATFKVKDLVFAHAGLEEVFMEFYSEEESA